VPRPDGDWRPSALVLSLLPIRPAAVVGLLPRHHRRTARQLDQRLHLGDRLATAWAFRDSDEPIVRLQRADALERIEHHAATTELRWRPSRPEVIALGAVAFLTCLLLITPS